MKLFLFGGAETGLGLVELELHMIEKVIKRVNPKQVLHVPFARTISSEKEWRGDWYHRHIHVKAEYLNAKNPKDLARARSPLVFISGGSHGVALLKKIKSNPRLLKLIKNADYVIGESAGTKILGSYFRAKGGDASSKLVPGLGIIKNTVVMPHYTERKRQKLLLKDMKDSGTKYGLGIDSATAITFMLAEFPKKYKVIGNGSVEIKKQT